MKLTLIHSNIEKRRGRRKTINGKIEKVLGKLYAVSDGIQILWVSWERIAQLRKRVTCILETSQEAARTIRASETEASVLLFLIRLCLTLHFTFLQQYRQASLAYPCLPQIIPSSCFFWWAIGDLEHAALVPCFLPSYCWQIISCTYRQNFVFTQFINAGTCKFPSHYLSFLTSDKSGTRKFCKSISATFIISPDTRFPMNGDFSRCNS